MIALTVLSFASCKDTEGSIGDPIISHGQDRDTDIITGDDYVYHLPVIFHVFYSNTTQRERTLPGRCLQLSDGYHPEREPAYPVRTG